MAAFVVNATFEKTYFQRSDFEHSKPEFQSHFYHTWTAARSENFDSVIHLHSFPLRGTEPVHWPYHSEVSCFVLCRGQLAGGFDAISGGLAE